ncbi:MAG TPA: hypothetical protein VLF67_04650 [Candidatus Saccharimonas sp.]|nr:hypothetical protein [Candidatus Saccharimonas sp.]
MKTFLYVRGQPGVGKITVARELERDLGWRLYWFHDLKNAVYNIVQEHRISRLMDAITGPVARHLLEAGHDVIYVRPSPDVQTVNVMRQVVAEFPEYRFVVVRLVADYDTLLERATGRVDPYRITTKDDLDEYLADKTMADLDDEVVVPTEGLSAREVAEQVKQALEMEVGRP